MKIIRELAEQNGRDSSETNADKPIQSLTTIRSMPNAKAKTTTTAQPLPANHKPAQIDASFLDKEMMQKTTVRAIIMMPTPTPTTTQKSNVIIIAQAVNTTKSPYLPNDIDDTFNNAHTSTTTAKATTTKMTTSSTTTPIPTTRKAKMATTRTKTVPTPSTNDDINFLKQVVSE